MYFNETEKYVLTMLAAGILQAGVEEGKLSKSMWTSLLEDACQKIGTSTSILSRKFDINPFQVIKQMTITQKEFVKTFLFEYYQKSGNSSKATYFFAYTLEQSGLIKEI